MKIVKLDEVEGMVFPAGRKTRVLTGPDRLPARNFTAGYVVIQPGGRIPPHSHSNEEIYLFLRGCGNMRVGPKEETVEAFTAVYIEPHAEHLLENTGDEEMILIFVYAPAGVADHWSRELEGKLK